MDGVPATAPSRGRRAAALTLVVIASLLAFLAIFSIWANRQLLNTQNWTNASSKMLANPVVRAQLADYMIDQLYTNVDVEGEIRAALPQRAQPLAGTIAGGLRNLAERQANQLLARPRAQQAWENANRGAHELLLQILNGGGSTVSTNGGRVVIDLRDVLRQTQQRVGVGQRLAKVLPPSAAQLTVLRSDQLKGAQTAFRIARPLPIVLVALSLLLFGVAVWIAPGWRRRAVRAYGIGFLAAGVAALAARSLLGDEVVHSLARTQAQIPAIQVVWTIATTLLDQAAVAAIGYGAVMVLGAWLAGPTRAAVAVRRTLAPYLREPALAYGGLVVILAAVLLWWQPTPATRNPVTALVLAALVGLGFEGLRRQTAREYPGADRREVARRRRERMSAAFGSVRRAAGDGTQVVVRQASSFAGAAATEVRARTAGMGEPAAEEARLDQLERLARLRDVGTLSDAEFQAEKTRILASEAPAD